MGTKQLFEQTTDAAEKHLGDKHKVRRADVRTEQPLIVASEQFFVRGSNCTFLVSTPRARLQSSSVVGKNTPDVINNSNT